MHLSLSIALKLKITINFEYKQALGSQKTITKSRANNLSSRQLERSWSLVPRALLINYVCLYEMYCMRRIGH